MKILMVVHAFPQSGGAGTEIYTKQLCIALQNKQHQVTVLTRGEPFFNGPASQILSRSTQPIPVYSYFRHPSDFDSPEKEYWNPDLDLAFVKLLDSIKPDVVHFQHCINLSISLITTAAQLGYPVFFTLHDFWTICPDIILMHSSNKPCASYHTTSACCKCISVKYKAPRIWFSGKTFYSLRRQRMKEALHSCQAVLALSNTVRQAAFEAGFDTDRIILWKSGIDTSEFAQKKSLSDSIIFPIRFGYIGTLSHQKGVDIALKAFHAIPSDTATLTIYGDLEADLKTKKRVKRWTSRYSHPSINFAGTFKRQDLPAILTKHDVMLAPSIWYENRPLSVLESFAAGNPVIGSHLGGIQELIEATDAGWTFPPGDYQSLAKIMASIITQPKLITDRRKNIPDVVTIEQDADNLERLYRNYLEKALF